MSTPSRWWTVLRVWHDWRAAVWNAVLTRETEMQHFNGGMWTSVSPLGRYAEVLANWHESRSKRLEWLT